MYRADRGRHNRLECMDLPARQGSQSIVEGLLDYSPHKLLAHICQFEKRFTATTSAGSSILHGRSMPSLSSSWVFSERSTARCLVVYSSVTTSFNMLSRGLPTTSIFSRLPWSSSTYRCQCTFRYQAAVRQAYRRHRTIRVRNVRSSLQGQHGL
jgi:hypothetical protein